MSDYERRLETFKAFRNEYLKLIRQKKRELHLCIERTCNADTAETGLARCKTHLEKAAAWHASRAGATEYTYKAARPRQPPKPRVRPAEHAFRGDPSQLCERCNRPYQEHYQRPPSR